jgi:4a-hydroxytetrahydrobiopterin dehydratase
VSPELLSDAELEEALSALPAWQGDTKALTRLVTAPDFPTGIRIVDDVALVSEKLDHHPDIDIRWKKLLFSLSTHSKGGVTGNDLELAGRIDAIVERHGGD